MGEPLIGNFSFGRVGLFQIIHPHGAQYRRRLGERDLLIGDELRVISPGIVEIDPPPSPQLDPHGFEDGAPLGRFNNHQPEVAAMGDKLGPDLDRFLP